MKSRVVEASRLSWPRPPYAAVLFSSDLLPVQELCWQWKNPNCVSVDVDEVPVDQRRCPSFGDHVGWHRFSCVFVLPRIAMDDEQVVLDAAGRQVERFLAVTVGSRRLGLLWNELQCLLTYH